MLTKEELLKLCWNNKSNELILKVIPNSSQNEIIKENKDQMINLKLYLHAVPDKNKANLELIRFFKKEFGLIVEIVRGMRSREKVIRILN